MDYEKKHKEEVVRATQLWECGDITRENLEYIFPELAWSEEERIRKEIISHLQYLAKYCNDSMPNVDKWIAWLEKQAPKITWTKEDEMALNDALWCCKKAASVATNENDMGNAWNAEMWLKSLLQRDRV